MILTELDPRFYLAPSTIPGAGLGLFAKVALGAGDEIPVLGVFVAANSAADECTRYADPYKLRVGDALLIPVGFAAMVNHSSQAANLEKVAGDHSLVLRAVRPVAAGEELLLCYSEYARARFKLQG